MSNDLSQRTHSHQGKDSIRASCTKNSSTISLEIEAVLSREDRCTSISFHALTVSCNEFESKNKVDIKQDFLFAFSGKD